MSGRNSAEAEGLSLLGNKKTVYKSDYAPEAVSYTHLRAHET